MMGTRSRSVFERKWSAVCRGCFNAAALLLLGACDSDRVSSLDSEDGELGSSEADDGSDRPLYGLVSRVTLPSGGNTMLAVLDSLEPQVVDTATALEIAGFAAAHGSSATPGSVFVASAEAPELVRYAVTKDAVLEREASFSLAGFGLSRAPRSIVFVSETKAYAISAETYQLFVWNPKEMIVERSIPLEMLQRPGYVPAWVFGAAVRGGQLVIPITWVRSDDGEPGAAPNSALVAVDIETDALEVQEEGRCGGFRAIYPAAAGRVHFASSAGAPVTWHRLYGERGGSAPCIVRWRDGEPTVDTSFLLRPAELSPHPVAVDFSPAGSSHLVFQALDESLVSAEATAEELWNAAAWRFYSIPATALDGAPVGPAEALALPPSALNALRFEVDGRNFVPQIAADYSETTVVDITDPSNPIDGPLIRGSAGNLFRIR